MRQSTTLLIPLLATLTLTPGLHAQVDARVWVDNEPEYFSRGDRMEVSFAVSDDSYVAVVHVDTDGNLEFVYPQSPWDNEYVRGGQVHRVSSRGRSNWTVRSRSGIGYFYIIASPTPLDFSYFRGRPGSPWDWGYAGQAIHGDPFIAFDQIARLLLPQWGYSPYVYDYYSYHVGGLHRYPTYACSDRYYDYGWGWSQNYGSCSSLDYFLRDRPYYYDTRRYRGDRRIYLRDYDRLDPRHGFKEDPDRPAARGATRRDDSGATDNRWATPRRDPVVEPRSTTRDQPAAREPARGIDRRAAPPRTAEPAGRSRPRPDADRRGAEPATTDGARAPARGRP